MRSLIIFTLALLAFATATLAQAPDTAWTRILNRPNEFVEAVTAGPSGNIVTAGLCNGSATWRVWGADGTMVDSNLTIGYASSDTTVLLITTIARCIDGSNGYILGGMSQVLQPSQRWMQFAARINQQGDVLWEQSYSCLYGLLPNSYVEEVVPRPDGSAILFGTQFSGQAFAIGVTASGEAQWCNTYPIGGGDQAYLDACIVGLPDGGAIMSGSDIAIGGTRTVRINAQGETMWTSYVQFIQGLLVQPDTILCAMNYDLTLYIFKMTSAGDTLWTHTYPYLLCWEIIAEPSGGWSILGSDSPSTNMLVRFGADGTILWSHHYPSHITRVARLRHADYAFLNTGTKTITKTESGPRGDPTNLTILPGWPDPNLALLSWKGAEWQFYQISASPTADGPFNQWIGGTSDTAFVVGLDSAAQFFRVVGVEQLE